MDGLQVGQAQIAGNRDETGAKLSPPVSSDSVRKRQIRLRDQMLALPCSPDASGSEHHGAIGCNKIAELMAQEPSIKYVPNIDKAIGDSRRLNIDASRLEILVAMRGNYLSALRDPLTFRAPDEIDLEWKRRAAFRIGLGGVNSLLKADAICRTKGDSAGIRVIEAEMAGFYEQDPALTQAGLLLAYFDGFEVAIHYLAKWYGGCDLVSDRRMIECYLEAVGGDATALERWTDEAAAILRERITAAEREQQLAAQLVEERRKREEAGRRAEAEEQREAERQAKQRLEEEERRQREAVRQAEEERKGREARRVAAEAQERSDRAATGRCIMCGKPLGWGQKLLGGKQHKECTEFLD